MSSRFTSNIINDNVYDLLEGMDLLKHGESAYPADAWVELQYRDDVSLTLPPNMRYHPRKKSFNDPDKMFPSMSKIIGGINGIVMQPSISEVGETAVESSSLILQTERTLSAPLCR